MAIENNAIALLAKGMVQDINIKSQGEGTYRFALNAILESEEGNLGSINNEQSNELCGELPQGFRVIGHCLTNDERIVIFAASDTESWIGLWNKNSCEVTELVRTDCLNFNVSSPMETMFRVVRDCEATVYFTDGINPYRSINIDNLDVYKDEDGNWVCSKFDFSPDLTVPIIDCDVVEDAGGQLKIGSYQFSIRYIDRLNNATHWFYVTRPIVIYESDQTEDFHFIQGGFNRVTNLDELGVFLSTKVIVLNISKLDTNFSHFQIGVVGALSGSGAISEAYILPQIEISQDTQQFLFRGVSPEQGAIKTVPDEFIVDPLIINIAKTHAQIDSRHILGNLEFKPIDNLNLQLAANNIRVRWVSDDTIPTIDHTVLGNSKHPLSTFKKQSFMGGEVLALSIQFLTRKGQWTSSFHIPGRTVLPHDTVQIPYKETLDYLPQRPSYNYWEVRSSALADGTLGYYETDTEYPSLECDGVRIFPEGKIRHHVMPDRGLVPAYTKLDEFGSTVLNNGTVPQNINLIGLEFSNIVYPNDDIVGHRFLVSSRALDTKTVIEMGLLATNWADVTEPSRLRRYGALSFESFSSDSPLVSYYSPRTQLLKEYASGTHFDFLGVYPYNRFLNPLMYSRDRTHRRILCYGDGSRRVRTFISVLLGQRGYIPFLDDSIFFSASIDARAILPPLSYKSQFSDENITLLNTTQDNNVAAIYLNQPIDQIGFPPGAVYRMIYQVVHRRYTKPYSNLSSIKYELIHNGYVTLEDEQVFYGGDSFITPFSRYELVEKDLEGAGKFLRAVSMEWFILESDINYGLTHSGFDVCNEKIRYNPTIFTEGTPEDELESHDYTLRRALTLATEDDCFLQRGSICRQEVFYNPDFHIRANQKALPQLIVNDSNYCDDCQDKYPYRIIASEKSFQTAQADARQVFKAANFTDLLGKDGAIQRLFVDKDQLYCMTERTTYFVPVGTQSVATNENNIYIGTGAIFSVPPRKISTIDFSYGGTQDKWSFIGTQFGSVWVDSNSSKITHMSSSMKEISLLGMNTFFEKELTLHLQRELSRINKVYPYRATTHPLGIGFISTYDPRYKRVLITKKDYKPLRRVRLIGEIPNTTDLFYDETTADFYRYNTNIPNTTPIRVRITDPRFFENKSYTISFSLIHDSWTSFHSYQPYYYFNDEESFYSLVDNRFWIHNKQGFQRYYGNDNDFIIEPVFTTPNGQPKVWDNLSIIANVTRFNPQAQSFTEVNDRTFYKGIFYSTNQISGEQELVLKDTAFMNNTRLNSNQAAIQKVDNRWQISEIRDYAINNEPIFSSNWADIQGQFYIDKVVNPAVIDFNKTLFQLSRIKGDYLACRLFFRADNELKLTVDFLNITNRISIR